ncbi:MAG TPA: HD domain-containing protein [Acidimicrobiales bacterium]|nr:HD domain-containing protein [Acidimicrobiales bacterium]
MVTPTYPARAASLDDVLAILRAGSPEEGTGKAMTALDHHLQCAEVLRRERPLDSELQVAGLLHDIGHDLLPGRPDQHGVVGGQYLADVFSERVCALVELHVDAKRYLVAVEPSYRDRLSATSAQTLIAQGEAMNAQEVAAFRDKPYHEDAVVLRRADEDAKTPGRPVPSLDAWVSVLEAVAR